MLETITAFINIAVVNICNLLAILVILIGISKALILYIKDVLFNKKAREAINESRLEIGYSFSLGLAFLIGASIVNTIVTPTWDDIGKLAAIIGIRTILNFFLLKDVDNLSEENNKNNK